MANQYEVDPRQSEFLKNYLDPKSDTFSNCVKSGTKAGYTEEYSRNLLSLMPDWLSTNIEESKLVKKALNNFDGLLDSTDERIKLDTSKFVSERLYKEKFSTRNELTGKDGNDLVVIPPTLIDKYELNDSSNSNSTRPA